MLRLHVDAIALTHPRCEHERPGGVHGRAVGRVEDHKPVAEFVPEPFDHQGPVIGQHAGGALLLGEVGEQVVGGERIEPDGGESVASGCACGAGDLAHEAAVRGTEFGGATGRVGLPERKSAGDAGGRRHLDAIAADVDDAPRARSEHEDITHARLVDHLFVEFPDPPATGPGGCTGPSAGRGGRRHLRFWRR